MSTIKDTNTARFTRHQNRWIRDYFIHADGDTPEARKELVDTCLSIGEQAIIDGLRLAEAEGLDWVKYLAEIVDRVQIRSMKADSYIKLIYEKSNPGALPQQP